MWNGHEVSVVLMTYAERDSIRAVIDGFFATGLVDEVLVIDNNAQAGTAEEVAQTRARLVHEPHQGYGHATRRGLLEARGELIVLAEPDGTFLPEDILKLLVYSAECDVVFGTRTTRELIWAEANMARLLRWGNWAVAKLIEALYNTSHLSDVGCTYRLLRGADRAGGGVEDDRRRQPRGGRDHAADDPVRARGSSRSRSTTCRGSGVSSVTGSPLKAIGVGLRMIGLILAYRGAGAAAPGSARPRSRIRGRGAADDASMSRLPLRRDRDRLRRVAARPRRRALPAQAGRVPDRGVPGRARRSTSAAAPACWRSGWPTGLQRDRRRPLRGDARGHARRGRLRRPRCSASGTELPFADDSFDLVLTVADDAPHRRARRGAARRWPRWPASPGPAGGS